MKNLTISALLILGLTACGESAKSVDAKSDVNKADVTAHIIKRLKEAAPEIPYGEVNETPVDGLYLVQIDGGETIYVSADGRYLISGEMFEVQKGKFVSLKQQNIKAHRASVLAAVKREETIAYAPEGATKAVIHIFTDVDCPYCTKLHGEIEALQAMGIEVRYLAYPRSGLFTPSFSKLNTAWCAENPQEMLPKLQQGEVVELLDCDSPVESQYALGNELGVAGTPTLIFEDGSMISGYKSAEQLAKLAGI